MDSYSPNDTDSELFIEHTVLNGSSVMFLVYGILVILTFNCMQNLIAARQRHGRVRWGMIVYIPIIFGWATLYLGTWANFVQQMFIDQRNYPGGPIGFYSNAAPISLILNLVAYAVIGFLAQGLLMYRCYIVWDRNRRLMVVPLLMYLTCIGLSGASSWEVLQPGDAFFTDERLRFTVPLYAIGITLNLILTGLIGGKIAYARYRYRAILGLEQSRVYTSVTSMLIESAAINISTSALAIANWCSPTTSDSFSFQNISFPLNAMALTISQVLIISKVARGHGYSNNAMTQTAASTGFNFSSRGRTSTVASHAGNAIPMDTWSKRDGERPDAKSPSSFQGITRIDMDISRDTL